MATQYFKKEMFSRQIFDSGNRPIPWEEVFGDEGVAQMGDDADPVLLKSLNDYADKRVGGVVRISPEIYETLKKNGPSPKSGPRLNPYSKIRIIPSQISQFQEPKGATSAAAVAANETNETDAPPTPAQFKARTRKINAENPVAKDLAV